MIRTFAEGLIAGYGIALPLGAIGVLIIGMGVRCGFRTGFMAGAGAATADVLYAALAVVAGSALSALLASFALAVRMLGGLVLIGMAAAGLRQVGRNSVSPQMTAEECGDARMYAQFVGLTIINPLTVIYFTALILGRSPQAPQSSLARDLPFVAGVGLSSLSWQSLLAASGSLAGGRLSPRFRLGAIVVGNLIVLGLGVRILLTGALGR